MLYQPLLHVPFISYTHDICTHVHTLGFVLGRSLLDWQVLHPGRVWNSRL